MISRKLVILALGLLLVLMTAGCFDLFDVPGVALSPDGSQVYFLGGTASGSGESDSSSTMNLSSISINGGQPTVIKAGEHEDVVSAFAVNPTNGDVAYMFTSKADGAHLMIYSGGSTRELVSSSALGSVSIGTMMQYSPDGSRIAVTLVQFPSDVTPAMLESEDKDLTPEQLAAMRFTLYLVNTADGSVTAVSDVDKERANTLAWSPSGAYLAYNAWVDSNGNGSIVTMPNVSPLQPGAVDASGAPDPGDTSHIFVYDVGAGTSTDVTPGGVNYAPVFISDTEVAYVGLDVKSISANDSKNAANIMAYDVASGVSRVAYASSQQALGVAVSADRQQIAWIESTQSQSSGAGPSGGEEESPSLLFVSGPNFENPRQIAELPSDFGIPDVPVFTPDGKSLVVSATGFLSATVAQFSSGFGDFGGDPNAPTATPAPVGQPIVKIDIATGASTEVYRGDMLNSSMFASIFSLATSGMLDQISSMDQGS